MKTIWNPLNLDFSVVRELRATTLAMELFDGCKTLEPENIVAIDNMNIVATRLEKALIDKLPSAGDLDYDDAYSLLTEFEDSKGYSSDYFWLPKWFIEDLREEIAAEDKCNNEEWTRSYNDHAADCNR